MNTRRVLCEASVLTNAEDTDADDDAEDEEDEGEDEEDDADVEEAGARCAGRLSRLVTFLERGTFLLLRCL